jgi:hypothetical protein
MALVPWDKWCDVPYQPDALVEPIATPINRIVITLDEQFDTCVTPEDCQERMREIQDYYAKEKDCPRVPYR